MRNRDHLMIAVAELFAEQSYCKRNQVGAVLAKDGRILVTGYNGTISGKGNDCEETTPCGGAVDYNIEKNVRLCYTCSAEYPAISYTTKCYAKVIGASKETVLHAEQNIIAFSAKNGISMEGCTMYTTTSPCQVCAKLLIQSGLKRVVYKDEYRDRSGIEFLIDNGVDCERIKDDRNQVPKQHS